MDFIKPVYPKESNTYIRKDLLFGKLKCKVSMKNEVGIVVCTEKLQE
jgi:3-hydroxyacyl-[acyl-carrier-protein] dehydratase